MKGLNLSLLLSLIILLGINGCSEESVQKEFNDNKNLVGYLDSYNLALYVNPGFRDSVLTVLLSREFVEDSTALFIVVTSNPLNFTYFFDSLWVDTVRHYYPTYSDLKIYVNADCGKVHPGFTSDCIGTFGEHRFWGRSMRWKVNEWKSCTAGSNICIESYERIGEIRYYRDTECGILDTTFTVRGIYEWVCVD